MSAICVGTIRVKNASAWEQYRSRVGATISQYGGEILFRGSAERCYPGATPNDAVVALKFIDLAAANRWHDSPEYQALVPIREIAADVSLVLYAC